MRVDRIADWGLSAADEAQIADLLGRCFATDFGGRSFFQQRPHLRLVTRAEDRIVGHMALHFRAVRLGGRLTRVAGLADVATDPALRGHGIAGALLQEVIRDARLSNAEFLLLFGTARLYAGAGFEPVANPMTWVDLTGARQGPVCQGRAEALMVLPLRGRDWDAEAQLDLLGCMF